jgi:hypothetical protein
MLPAAAAATVDEVCVAWALLPLSTLPSLQSARKLRLPLRGGSLTRRLTLQQCGQAGAATALRPGAPQPPEACANGSGSCSSCLGTALPVKLAPVPSANAAAPLLPAAAVATQPVAQAAALYRQLLAEAVVTAQVCVFGRSCLAPHPLGGSRT